MTAIVEVHDLVKQYDGATAVNGVSFSADAGRCMGLLGPNGAGKTTTIEMMEGILRPTSGEIRFRGEPIGRGYRERIGIQFQNTALQDFLTVRENLRFFGSLYDRQVDHDWVIETCRLDEFVDRDSRKLSGGQRQRLLLGIALLNDPDLLFLDEPTTGLDPQARRNFWSLIHAIKAAGKTIILTTHYMDEADQLCDDIAIMDHGRIIARGSPATLLSTHYNDVVIELPHDALPPSADLPFEVLRVGQRAEIMTDDVNAVIQALLSRDVSLERMTIRPRTLEDLFIELTGRELRA